MIAGFLDTQFLMYLHVIPCNSIAIGRINRRKSTCEKEFNADFTSITTVPVTTRFFPYSYRHCLPTNTFPYHSIFRVTHFRYWPYIHFPVVSKK